MTKNFEILYILCCAHKIHEYMYVYAHTHTHIHIQNTYKFVYDPVI